MSVFLKLSESESAQSLANLSSHISIFSSNLSFSS